MPSVTTFAKAADAGIIDYTNGQEGGGLVQAYLLESFKKNFKLAMDAQAQLTTMPNAGIPNFRTNWVDPAIYEILFSPLAENLGRLAAATACVTGREQSRVIGDLVRSFAIAAS